ncbi:ABC transporter substrate-binding protein, partial [Aeromonas salmonicida]
MDPYTPDNSPTATIKRYGTADEAYLDLKAGRVDWGGGVSEARAEGRGKKEGGEGFENVGM